MRLLINVHDKRWNKYKIDFQKIANAVVGTNFKNSEVSLILTDDKEIKKINKLYRNINKPTNVLSFELEDDLLLGDVYVSFDTVKKEAEQEKIKFSEHATHMLVHGVLHLLGYDHIKDKDAKIMEKKEINILKTLGIKNPYQEDNEFVCKDEACCPASGFVTLIKKIKVPYNGFWQYALYALFGGVASFGFAPFYHWWCTVVGVAGAYWLTVRNKDDVGFWCRLLRVAPFGAIYAIAMFWWVLHSIYVIPEIAEQFAIWTIPGLVGLAIAGVFIFSWPFVAISYYSRNSAYRAVLFASVWALVLWAREWVFTGFPWNPIANITIQSPMVANSMSLWGALGLSFVLVGLIASFVEILMDRKFKSLWYIFILFFVLLVGGVLWGKYNMMQVDLNQDDSQKIIRLVQPAQEQEQKATHDKEQLIKNAENNLKKLFDLAKVEPKVDLIVFPETAYPFTVMTGDVMPLAQALGTDVVVGASVYDGEKLFNSMLFADKFGNIQKIYSKSHLVPFGEYSPFGVLPSPANLSAGNGAELIEFNDIVFAPAICYEIIFSGAVVPKGENTPDAILNITNDNWFGNTPGTYQHLDMVRRYAIESGVPVVRANYSGISAFVLADGNVVASMPVGEFGVLDGFVWGGHNTPYRTLGMNFWMIVILLFANVSWCVFRREN